MQKPEVECKKMKINQFNITPQMSEQKSDLPEFTWDDIIRLGLKTAKILSHEDKQFRCKELYWFAQKSMSELMAI
jgi:hypothetical protein